MNDLLSVYEKLETLVKDLDDKDYVLADELRDLMDDLWYHLTDNDIIHLNTRGTPMHDDVCRRCRSLISPQRS